jgi:hypothetical protein
MLIARLAGLDAMTRYPQSVRQLEVATRERCQTRIPIGAPA